MYKLTTAKRAQALQMMAEGISLRAIVRLTGISRTTLIKLLEDAGQAFSEYQDRALMNLNCKRLQVDEAWAFCYAKQKNVPTAKAAPEGAGDIWTWVGLDAQSKLAVSWYVGGRDSEAAMIFMDDLAKRLANRVQLTSDGHKAYLEAVEGAFGSDIDYAMLVKVYGPAPEGQRRYSPAECIGTVKHRVEGNPDPKHVSTSYAERQNLNIRMGNRRMTRLTNAFSKKAANHDHMMAIYFMHYNFVRIHQTLKVTPAMAAGVSAKLWEMSDMVKVLEDWEASTARGPSVGKCSGNESSARGPSDWTMKECCLNSLAHG
ncbi:MAG: helix-turn-helix domain-containing protein [Xanthobacteraceae bacterium]